MKTMLEIYPKLFEILWKLSPKWGPGGFSGPWEALPRGREASGAIFHEFGGLLGVHFGTHLGGSGDRNRAEVDCERYQELKSIELALGWLSAWIFPRLRSRFGTFWEVISGMLPGGRRQVHVHIVFHRFSTSSAISSLQ